MAKWGKRILGLAVIGSAVAGLVYYFKHSSSDVENDAFDEDLEDEDFDLDNDLKPVSDREYVPLNPSPKGADENTEDSTPVGSDDDKKKPVIEETLKKELGNDVVDIAADIASEMKNADFESAAK